MHVEHTAGRGRITHVEEQGLPILQHQQQAVLEHPQVIQDGRVRRG